MGLPYCEGEQSTKFNNSVITHCVYSRLQLFLSSFGICVSENKTEDYRQVLVTVIPKHTPVLKMLLSKTLQLGSWQAMICKEGLYSTQFQQEIL